MSFHRYRSQGTNTNCNTTCSADVTVNCSSLNYFWKKLCDSLSLLNKIIEGNIDVIETVNLVDQRT